MKIPWKQLRRLSETRTLVNTLRYNLGHDNPIDQNNSKELLSY